MGQFIVIFRKKDSSPKETRQDNARSPTSCIPDMHDVGIQDNWHRLDIGHSTSIKGTDVVETHAGTHVCCGN